MHGGTFIEKEDQGGVRVGKNWEQLRIRGEGDSRGRRGIGSDLIADRAKKVIGEQGLKGVVIS